MEHDINQQRQYHLLQLFDAQVTELVGRALLPVMLDGEHATGIGGIFHIRGHHAIDFNLQLVAPGR